MHDIKYFILNQNHQTIRKGANNFFSRGDRLLKVLPKNTIFQNPKEGSYPLDPSGSAPLIDDYNSSAYFPSSYIISKFDIYHHDHYSCFFILLLCYLQLKISIKNYNNKNIFQFGVYVDLHSL
jgi:hypothetical protein